MFQATYDCFLQVDGHTQVIAALAKRSHRFCKCVSEWATVGQRHRRTAIHESVHAWYAKQRRLQEQSCLTPLQIGKVLDMEQSNWTLAFIFSWNTTRMESSGSGQPNSLSMLYKPDRLTVSKALVRSVKTTYSGRDCSTEWDSLALPFRQWTFRRWNVKCVFLWNATQVQKFAMPPWSV